MKAREFWKIAKKMSKECRKHNYCDDCEFYHFDEGYCAFFDLSPEWQQKYVEYKKRRAQIARQGHR